jgi:conjugative relaxase-like TrwC/TraI family protein
MLTIYPIINRDYYQQWTSEDYYQGSGGPQGQWTGYTAHLLGLSGNVKTSVYRNLLDGYSPNGKQALVQNPGDDHAPGWDLTFSAPKSVSILQVFDEHGIIQRVHELAVKAALSYIEEHAAFTRRGAGGKDIERLPGLLSAMFTHFESRSVNSHTEDMQLHSHLLIFNVAQRFDLSSATIFSKRLYQFKMAAGAAYRAELAQQLRLLGYTIEADKDSFHVVGVPKDICEYYSKRAEQVENNLKEIGARTSASALGKYAKLKGREKKEQTPLSELNQRWQAELTTLGFDKELANATRHPHPTYSLRFMDSQLALSDLTENNSMFRKQDLHHQLAKQAQLSGDNINNISFEATDCLASKQVINLGHDYKKNQLYTTLAVIEAEHQMINLAKTLSQQMHKTPDTETFNKALFDRQLSADYALSDEQVEGLIAACAPKRLTILQGAAGSGKSISMKVLRLIFESMGDRVCGVTVPKKAADNLQHETGINSMTLAMLLTQVEKGRNPLANINVLVVDEAGLIGTFQMKALLQVAHKSMTKVVLVGEDKQLQSISHGGVLKYLSRPDVINTSIIKNIRRQRKQSARQVVSHLREGEAEAALKLINEENLVNFASDKEESISQLVAKWKDFTTQNPDKETVVLAQRWADVEVLSKQLREVYQTRKLVSDENLEFKCVVSNKPMTLPFSTGDRVRFAKNDYRLDVSNGTLGIIKGLKQFDQIYQFNIELDDGREVVFSSQDYQDEFGRLPLVHAYAMTVYSSQGITIDSDTFVLYNANMDRANTYVAGSRSKDNCHWFINAKEVDTLALPNDAEVSNESRLRALATLMSREQPSNLAVERLTDEQHELYFGQPLAEICHMEEQRDI